jgi:hypothetical protein
MRSLRLLGVAAQAEGLRLKRELALTVRGVVFQAAAAVFGVAALILLHVSGYSALAEEFGPALGALMVAGVDLALAGVLLLLGRRGTDRVADEALQLRNESLAALQRTSLTGEALRAVAWRSPAAAMGGAIADHLVRTLARR